VSLQPGKTKLSVDEMVKTCRGVYIADSGSFSIDQQRY
jgi:predicted Zn-dependent protease